MNRVRRTLGAAISIAVLVPLAARADSLVLHWTAPGDDGNVGRASAYELRYAESGVSAGDTTSWWNAPTTTSAGPLPVPLTAGSREAFTVAGLDSGKTYYFIIRAADEVPNWSGFSNVAIRSTGGGSLATPSNFAALLVSGGVRLRWDQVTTGAAGYHLYRRAAGASIGALIHTATITETSWIDSTAVGGTTYDYSITSYSGSSESSPAVATISVPGEQLTDAGELVGYPNPASGRVTLRFRAGTPSGGSGHVRLVIYDLTGHLVRELIDENMPAGETAVDWLCQSDRGNHVAPGLYNAILDSPLGRRIARLAILP